MLAFNIGVAGLVFLAIFTLVSLIQAARKDPKAGCLSTVSAVIGFSLLIASIILSSLSDEAEGLTLPVLLGSLGVLAALSLVIYFLERRSDEFRQLYSRGLMGLGASILLLVSTFFIPVIPQQIFPIPTATPIAQAIRTGANTQADASGANIVPTDVSAEETPTERVTVVPTQTYTPMASPSPTRTRRAYIPPTATATLEAEVVAEECDGRVTVNLNVRAEPDTDAEIVAIVPEGRTVRILGRSEDERWWLTEFEGEDGWLFGDLLELDAICFTVVN